MRQNVDGLSKTRMIDCRRRVVACEQWPVGDIVSCRTGQLLVWVIINVVTHAPARSDAYTHSSWLVVLCRVELSEICRRWTSPAVRSVCGVVWSHAGRMPCVAADNDCQMTDSSLACDNLITSRRHSDRLTPSVAAASKTSSSSSCSSACRRLPMWRSLSSLWKKSSSNAVTRSTSAGDPAVDTPSETQPCSFVRHFVSPLRVYPIDLYHSQKIEYNSSINDCA